MYQVVFSMPLMSFRRFTGNHCQYTVNVLSFSIQWKSFRWIIQSGCVYSCKRGGEEWWYAKVLDLSPRRRKARRARKERRERSRDAPLPYLPLVLLSAWTHGDMHVLCFVLWLSKSHPLSSFVFNFVLSCWRCVMSFCCLNISLRISCRCCRRHTDSPAPVMAFGRWITFAQHDAFCYQDNNK